MKRKALKCQLSVIQLQDANTKFDVLIANTSHSPKYEIAVLRNIPIVSRVWMDACAESGELTYEYEKFPFKFFTDCVVCVTGFQWEERNGIQEMVEKNGGVFSADLEKDVVTHLIAKQTSAGEEPTGAKYRHARMWDMWVLSKKWVEDCVKRGVKLNEYEYDVKNGISNSKQTDSSLDMLKKQPAVPLPTKEELTKELEEEYDEDQTPWGQHYLFSTKVYLVGFSCSSNSTSTPAAGGTAVDPNDILRPSAKNARLAHKILRAGGATVAMNPQNATHVLINDDLECQKDVDFILRTCMRPHREKCVTFEWLKKCSEEGRTMPKSKRFRVAKERFSEVIAAPTFCNDPVTTFDDDDKKTSFLTNYKNDNTSPPRRIPERSPLKVIDKDKNPLRRQPAMVKKDDIETQQHAPAVDDIVVRRGNDKQQSRRDNKNNKYNTMTEQIPETRAAIGETALVNNEDEDDALLLGRNGYNSRNESSDHSSKQSQLYPLANVKLSLFEGLCIGEKEVALNLISLLGGEYLRGSSTSTLASSDFIICPALPSMSEKKKLQALASDIASAARETPDAIFSARFVAPHFLEGVSLEGKIFKPSESMAYQPYMDHDGKFLSMKGVVLSPSSYTEREKSAIRMLSLICGCECTENLKKGKNTHVVVSKAEGSKYKAGVNWNKKVVTKEWLEECARKGHKVDESKFAPPLPGAMLEETQGEETLNDDATADAKKRSDPSIEGGGSGSGGEKTVEKTAEKKIAYAEEEEEEEEDIAPPMGAPMDEEDYFQKLPPPPPVVVAHQHQALPTSAMKTPSATTKTTTHSTATTQTTNKKSSLEHVKTHSRFQRTPGPSSTAKKTPNGVSSQHTNGNNKNVAAIPIQKITIATAKKSTPSKQQPSQQQQQHQQQQLKSSGSVGVKRNPPSQHRSPTQPSIDGKRKLPLTSTTTQKKKQNSEKSLLLLSPMFDGEDDDGNVNNSANPLPMNLFNNNNEAATTRNANLNMLMMKSPSPAKNKNNNTNEETDGGFDDNSDVALPDFEVGGIGATLPNTLNIALGSARKNFNGAGENPSSTLNMETQVGYGNAASLHAHHQTSSKLEALRSRRLNTRSGGGTNKNAGGALKNLIGGRASSPLANAATDNIDNNKDEWMK